MSPSLLLLAVVLELGSAIAPIDRATIDHGRVLYLANCSRCHGSTGIGDGPDAGLLVKQPADLRRSGALVGVYIGLVLAYGGLSLSKSYVGIDAVKNILTGVVTASALLHFYYDGFIWKVREKSTRQSLGIAGGTADVSLGGFLPGWALHGAKWVAIFVIPLGILWFAEIQSGRGKEKATGDRLSEAY